MKYQVGQSVILQGIGGIQGRRAKITEVIKVKGKRALYILDVQGLPTPYHCISDYFVKETAGSAVK